MGHYKTKSDIITYYENLLLFSSINNNIHVQRYLTVTTPIMNKGVTLQDQLWTLSYTQVQDGLYCGLQYS